MRVFVFVCNDALAIFSSSECKNFEADWKRKNIENTTDLKTPLTAGAVVQIRCVGGQDKLSGPGAVTCIEGTNFSGLNNVTCYSKYSLTSSLGS